MRSQAGAAVAVLLATVGSAHAQCTWTQHEPYPVSGFDGAAVYHAGLQRVLFLNGMDTGGVSIRSWDGATWTLISAAGPSNRSGMAAAYDSARGRIVMYGGKEPGGQFPNDTWEWNGLTWTNVGPPGPSGRWHHGMMYDPWRQKTVMFGGSINGYFNNETWEWDGSAWLFISQEGPGPREVGGFTYDPVRHRVFLYGSNMQSPYPTGYSTDMWEWDGVSWLQWLGSSYSRQGGWLLSDPARGRLILGQLMFPFSIQGHCETWELDTGTGEQNWTVGDPGVAPAGPGAFDAARGKAVFLDREYSPAPNFPPGIIQQPWGGTYYVGNTATMSAFSSGTGQLTLQWMRDGQPLANGGRISGVDTNTLTISALERSDTGAYQLNVTNSCGMATSYAANVAFYPECYANCDNSTTPPILNANDFQCFLNAFARGSEYANCDHGYSTPVLTANDFQCFLNSYAAGCS